METIIRILKDHGINTEIREGRIIAIDLGEETDVTNYSLDQLEAYLGY